MGPAWRARGGASVEVFPPGSVPGALVWQDSVARNDGTELAIQPFDTLSERIAHLVVFISCST
jgi:hypothetical protein